MSIDNHINRNSGPQPSRAAQSPVCFSEWALARGSTGILIQHEAATNPTATSVIVTIRVLSCKQQKPTLTNKQKRDLSEGFEVAHRVDSMVGKRAFCGTNIKLLFYAKSKQEDKNICRQGI